MAARSVKSAALAVLAAAAVLAAVSGATAAGPNGLRRQLGNLESQRRSAALDLYAIDSRIGAAQQRLTTLQQQAAVLRMEQQRLELRIAVTRQTITVSRNRLAVNLRRLYKQGDVNTLAVLLGSQSLDDAVSTLDTLSAVADESKQVVSVTSAAQHRLGGLRARLVSRAAHVAAAVAEAQRTLDDLSAARAQRVAFIVRLRAVERLRSAQIAALETRVRRAQQKSVALQAAAAPAPEPAPTAPTRPTAARASDASSGTAAGRTITVTSTGYSLPGHTATGLPVGWGVVAVDPGLIPLGTKLTIPGYGEGVAADVGSGVRGPDIDLWFPTLAQARAWGRRTITITLH